MQHVPTSARPIQLGNNFTQTYIFAALKRRPSRDAAGIAVYRGGIRVNEAFGDTINWDLIPTIAIGRADAWTNNPVSGSMRSAVPSTSR